MTAGERVNAGVLKEWGIYCVCTHAAMRSISSRVIVIDKRLMQIAHSSHRDCFTVSTGLGGLDGNTWVWTHKTGKTTQRKNNVA